jgi:hypothetical protein
MEVNVLLAGLQLHTAEYGPLPDVEILRQPGIRFSFAKNLTLPGALKAAVIATN